MPQRTARRRDPAPHRRPGTPQPTRSHRRRTPAAHRRWWKPSTPIDTPRRCNSEPTLWPSSSEDDRRSVPTTPDGVLFRPQTCTDIYSSSDYLPPQYPKHIEGYSREAKVVVNVIVEGSPGPIRTMVRLGSSVEDTIKLVIRKYSEEGRSPPLDQAAASTFQLHQSYFSLESKFQFHFTFTFLSTIVIEIYMLMGLLIIIL